MKIGGFQKLSLIDFPDHICSIVFTGGCLFRCSYCHNPDLIPFPKQSTVSQDEVLDYLKKHATIIGGVCITGGEPTMQSDLKEFIQKVKKHGFDVKLDTNGIQPHTIEHLLEENLLDYIAMDLKAPWSKYLQVIKFGNEKTIANVRETFCIIQESGVPHEFRTTIFPGVHTVTDFEEMVSYLKEGEKYYIQNTSFRRTLDPLLPREIGFSAPALTERLRERFPMLCIQER
ncbi:anaerobic ribonucleoside-triphosphate reductase activating protein [Candidatus Uhrbacteria bacterium]|nr:anaerobic ribonucleoside-triphosphate reductase activating protein [Candidatus Uhrbacteria bacterium]